MGFIGMIKMVACLVAQQRGDIRQSDNQSYPEGWGLPNNNIQLIAIICNNHDARTWHEVRGDMIQCGW